MSRAKSIEFAVDRIEGKVRLDRYLAGLGTWGTRSRIRQLIDEERVRVNGRVARPATLVRPRDVIAIALPEKRDLGTGVEPEAIPVEVLYEDGDILAVNKPAGLVVHPAPGHWRGTLVHALLHHWKGVPQGLDPTRLGIVHRLDRDTSGVLLVGKTPEAVEALGAQFRSREVEKEYLALVWGSPRPARGVVDRPVARHPVQRKRMAVRPTGRRAVTRFETVRDFADFALLRVLPETGRTHQIRVHLAAIGHPVVGDPTYGRRRTPEWLGMRRQALHALALRFRHPRSGERMRIRAPVPPDLAAALASLGERRHRA